MGAHLRTSFWSSVFFRQVSELSGNLREHYVYWHFVLTCVAFSPEECLEDCFFHSAWLWLTKFRARVLCNERSCGYLVRLGE